MRQSLVNSCIQSVAFTVPLRFLAVPFLLLNRQDTQTLYNSKNTLDISTSVEDSLPHQMTIIHPCRGQPLN